MGRNFGSLFAISLAPSAGPSKQVFRKYSLTFAVIWGFRDALDDAFAAQKPLMNSSKSKHPGSSSAIIL